MTGNTSDEKIRQDLEELLGRYKELASSKSLKEMKEFSEANVRANFIDPLFKILGWKTDDMNEYSRESYIQDVGFADIEIKLDGEPKVFVEAKRFGGIPHIKKRGDADWTMEERQVILYAASRNCRWAVLTNFEKLRVYNALTGLTILNFESIYDLTDRFRELLYLTKHSVETGRIEKLADKEEKPDIDIEFLKLLNNWRISLANDIYQRNRDNGVLQDDNGQLDLEKLKDAVQRILDRIVIIRWAEDNLVVDDPYLLGRKLDEWKVSPIYNSIVDSLFGERALFDKFNKVHDGKIFERGHICEQVEIGDEVLGGIIQEMNQRSFRKFDFDILGNTYETYLGNTLSLKDDGTLGLKPSMESRKESGIYYTPPYVVDYIVENTLGELLKDKTPEEVSKIKVLDPACGSGSFLIKAYDYFKDYYEKENEKISQQKERLIEEIRQANGSQMNFENTKAYEFKEHRGFEQEILRDNIHGVDLDRQAAEIASVNLMLKALKPGERLPPILGENIKVGNSLISGTEEELNEYFGDDCKEKHPFYWNGEFCDVFSQDGFDVVIGNPPWVSFGLRAVGKIPGDMDKYLREIYLHSAEYKLSVYALFINLAINLLKEGGVFGFIVPDSFLLGRYFSKLRRYILDTVKIKEIMLVMEDFWPHGTVGRSVVIILQKESNRDFRENNEIKAVLCSTLQSLGEKKFESYSYTQNYFENVPFNRFRLFFNEESKELVEKIELNSEPLGSNIADLYSGCIGRYGQSSIVSDIKKEVHIITDKDDNIVYRDDNANENWKPILESGGDIGRYSLRCQGKYLYFDEKPTNMKIYAKSGFDKEKYIEKLFLRQTGDTLIATYDDKGYFCLNNMHVINILDSRIDDYNLKYVLAILNCKLINHYYHLISLELGRAMAQTDIETIELLPIKPANDELQQQFIQLVNRMLSLNEQLMEFPADYWHYVNLRPYNMVALSSFIDVLPANDKEGLKDHFGKPLSTIKSKKFEGFEVAEEGDRLIFNIGYKYEGSKRKIMSAANVKALRLRIPDEKMRKFIFYSLKDTTPGKLGRGNVLQQIYKIKIPKFAANRDENANIIEEIMIPFLEEVENREN